MKKERKKIDNIKCDVCGYQNHNYYVKESGVCHLCGKILDDKAYFKSQMVAKLRLWKGKRRNGCSWWNLR